MMEIKTLTVVGAPIGQPRAKATTVGGFARMYNPRHPVDSYKAAIRYEASTVFHAPFSGAVGVSIMAIFPRPKNKIWKRRQMPAEPHIVKPDIDNIAKAVLDALQGLAWRDDCQIAKLTVRKRIAAHEELPRTFIAISLLEKEIEHGVDD